MQSDTTATVRKEILEDAKREIELEISHLFALREQTPTKLQYDFVDAMIDEKKKEKDNLPQALFNDEEGTHPSPVISGGEVMEVEAQTGDGTIPF